MSTCSLGAGGSDIGASIVAVPVDPFSVRGKSVVDWEDLCEKINIGTTYGSQGLLRMETNRWRLLGISGDVLLDLPAPLNKRGVGE